jgi:hypothetical protein
VQDHNLSQMANAPINVFLNKCAPSNKLYYLPTLINLLPRPKPQNILLVVSAFHFRFGDIIPDCGVPSRMLCFETPRFVISSSDSLAEIPAEALINKQQHLRISYHAVLQDWFADGPVRHKSLCDLSRPVIFFPCHRNQYNLQKQKMVSHRMIVALVNPVICPYASFKCIPDSRYASISPRPPSQQRPISA